MESMTDPGTEACHNRKERKSVGKTPEACVSRIMRGLAQRRSGSIVTSVTDRRYMANINKHDVELRELLEQQEI